MKSLRLIALLAASIGLIITGVIWFRSGADTPKSLLDRGLIAIQERRYTDVATIIEQLDQDPDGKQQADLLQAVFLMRTGETEAALRTMAKVDPEGPLRHRFLEYSGEALYTLGRLREARGLLTRLVSESPDSVNGQRWLASTYYDLGAQHAAVHHLKEVCRLAPDDYRPHWLLGVIYRDFENYPESIRHLIAAWGLKPPEAIRDTIGVYLSRSLRADRHYDQALPYLQQCNQTNEVLVERARCEFNLSHVDVAMELLQKTTPPEEEDAGVEYYLLWGEILDAQNKPEEALARYQEGAQKYAFDEDLQYAYAISLKAQGQVEKANQEMAVWEHRNNLKIRLVELNQKAGEEPDNAQVRRELAQVCREMQRPKLAAMWEAAANSCVEGQQQQAPTEQKSP